MNKSSDDTLDIMELARRVATQGSKGPPMSTRDALKHLAKHAADPVSRQLARQRLRDGAPVLWIGRRFTSADPDATGPLYGDKFARRILRRRGIRAASRIERALDAVRRRNADTRAMASNSHEARRAIAEDVRTEAAKRRATPW